MVKLMVGRKGSGKTRAMVDMANDLVQTSDGSIVFINKDHRLMYDLKYRIRVVSMSDYEFVNNIDEYIGFIYGIISSDHDIEAIFIDSILKYSNIGIGDVGNFLTMLDKISKAHELDFYVSLSADLTELGDAINGYEILNTPA